jgi:hypothetical protein
MGRYWKQRARPVSGGAAVVDYMDQHPLVRIRDLRAAGVTPLVLWLGMQRRVAPGVWAQRDWPVVRTAVAAKRVPRGVVCLASALFLHGLAAEPAETWIAIDAHAWKPTFREPPVRTVRFSGQALEGGVEVHSVYGTPVRVYGVAKTVADLFKYRNKLGRDMAVSALRDALLAGLCSELQLWHWGSVCRVAAEMAPYLRALRRWTAHEDIPPPPKRTPFAHPAWERPRRREWD